MCFFFSIDRLFLAISNSLLQVRLCIWQLDLFILIPLVLPLSKINR